MFKIEIAANPDLTFTDGVTVADGVAVRWHDVAFVLRRMLAGAEQKGATRVATVSEVAAAEAKVKAAQDELAKWTPTLDGVSCMNGTYSRTYVKDGHTESVVAVCRADGEATLDTAAMLAKWSATESNQMEA